MSKNKKPSGDEILLSLINTSMFRRAQDSSNELAKKFNENMSIIKKSRFLSPIILRLYEDKKISEDKKKKLFSYLSDKEYDKVEKYLKSKFPSYISEPKKSVDDTMKEIHKAHKDIKKKTKKIKESRSGKGFPYNSDSDSSSDESSSESEEEKPPIHPHFIKKPLKPRPKLPAKKKFSKKIEKEILDYLKKF